MGRIAAKDIGIFGSERLEKELWIVIGRHESASWDDKDPAQVAGYWRNTYDPGLSEKGRLGAEATALNLIPILAGRKVLWITSPMLRALETAKIWAPKDTLIIQSEYLAPADFSDFPAVVILAWMQHQNDMLVYQNWIGSSGFWRTWTNARVVQTLLTSGLIHKGHGVDTIVCIGHCEQVSMLLCAFASVEPEDFVLPKYQIKRGEFALVKITPEGEVKIERPKFEYASLSRSLGHPKRMSFFILSF